MANRIGILLLGLFLIAAIGYVGNGSQRVITSAAVPLARWRASYLRKDSADKEQG